MASCLNCGNECRFKFCSPRCRSNWHSRQWRKAKGDAWRTFHASVMRARRLLIQGPRRPPLGQTWRGAHETALCEWCHAQFERTKQPREKRFCKDQCRSKARNLRADLRFAEMHRNANSSPQPRLFTVPKVTVERQC